MRLDFSFSTLYKGPDFRPRATTLSANDYYRSFNGSASERAAESVLRFPVALPEGSHPIPSRTRKLSPPGPMVLQSYLCGRVGRRRILFETPLKQLSGVFFFVRMLLAISVRSLAASADCRLFAIAASRSVTNASAGVGCCVGRPSRGDGRQRCTPSSRCCRRHTSHRRQTTLQACRHQSRRGLVRISGRLSRPSASLPEDTSALSLRLHGGQRNCARPPTSKLLATPTRARRPESRYRAYRPAIRSSLTEGLV